MDILMRLKRRTGEEDEALLEDLLESAKSAILSRLYQCKEMPVCDCGEAELEFKYWDLQYRIALDLYNKMGAEGETNHAENGITRHYESSWISEQLLAEITPYCGLPV